MRTEERKIASLSKAASIIFAAVVLLFVISPVFGENPALRGTQWVRSHEFTINALVGREDSLVPEMYRDANMSSFMSWWPVDVLLQASEQAGLPWHMNVYPHPDGLSDWTKSESIRLNSTYANNAGWLVWDEPNRLAMDTVAQSVQWYKNQFPDTIVYSNALPAGGPSQEFYYGGTVPAGGYSYDNYVTDFVNIIQPDVMMYDVYPFRSSDGGTSNYFPTMMTVRQKALNAGIPYFAWIQSYESASLNHRTPSESDLRSQVFNNLACGAKGISYFTYDYQVGHGMVEPNQTPNQLYYDAQKLNTEVANLGKVLKHLHSTDVRYVPGRHDETFLFWTNTVENDVPSSLSKWSYAAGGDPHILDIEVVQKGEGLDGLVGFFTDDDGEKYFMLVNQNHGENSTAAQTHLTFKITFDGTVDEIFRLNRTTGRSQVIGLDNNTFEFILTGGTGDLFKYDTGEFVPEPISILGMTFAGLAIIRKRKAY